LCFPYRVSTVWRMSEYTTTLIDLIRHGEPVGGRKYRGQLDDPLSEKGWRQMREAVGDHCPWSAIVSSPLARCSAFAGELAERHGLPLYFDDRLREIGFGAWEGKTATELLADDPERLARFWRDPINHTPPGAETLHAFRERITAGWNALLECHAGRHVLVVGHAGMMRMIIREVLEMPLDRMFRLQVGNAAISRIRIDGSGAEALPQLVFHDGRL